MFFRGARGFDVSFAGGRLRLALGVAIAAWAVLGINAGPALAKSKSFTSAGCSTWKVPAGVSSVSIQATGSAGQAVNAVSRRAASALSGDRAATASASDLRIWG
jgi:hypothetical protein